MGSEWILGRLASTGSGQRPVAGCCECGDEPSGSCATELVSLTFIIHWIFQPLRSKQFEVRATLCVPSPVDGKCIDAAIVRMLA
jgi:hypothetical protein